MNLIAIDEAATRLIANIPKSSRPFFVFMSQIGHPIAISCTAGIIVLLGLFTAQLSVVFDGASIWIAMLISTALKNLTRRSRPLTDYVAGMRIRSFSFPSGHTTGSTITFGILAYYALLFAAAPFSYLILTACSLLILSIGISRVYLGAHFPTDVIGGWVLGLITLAIVVTVVGSLT